MQNIFTRRSTNRSKPTPIKSRIFHGINQAIDPNDMRKSGDCWASSAFNTWIDQGNVTVRNNYAVAVASINTDMADAYTYHVKSLGVYAPKSGTKYLVAGVQAKLSGAHHHYCVLHRVLSGTGTWTEVKCAAVHGIGTAGDSIWFSNANFGNMPNDYGDYNETGAEISALLLFNGSLDAPAFYTPSGLGVLGSTGWKAVTAYPGSNMLTSTIGATNGDIVEFYSRAQDIPGGLAAWTAYYVVSASGDNFYVSTTVGGSAIDITSAGTNVSVRIIKDYGAWVAATYSSTSGFFTCASLATLGNGTYVQANAPDGTMPRGMATSGYYIVNTSGSTFQVARTSGGDPLTFTSNGSNIKMRYIKSNPKDAPRGKFPFTHKKKIWVMSDFSAFHNAGYYDDPKTEIFDGKAHPNDWSTAIFSGNFPIQTNDGEIIAAATVLNGKPWIAKKSTVFTVYGDEPPFSLEQVFTAKGTIAPDSLCWHRHVGLMYVTPEGVEVFNGATSSAWISDEIRDLWSPDNADAKCAVVGDTFYMYGNFMVSGSKVKRLLAVDIPGKNINVWTLAYSSSTLTVDAILPANFTTFVSGVTEPEFWFASDDVIYKYSTTAPTAGNAVPFEYTEPESDYSTALSRKRLARLAITGSGGTLTITPTIDGTAKTAITVELPRKQPISLSAGGYRIGLKYSSTNDPIIIKDIERGYQ
jgi:hypothetical protein